MELIRRIIGAVVSLVVRARTQVDSHASARIRWTALWGTRGGGISIGEGSIVNCRIGFDDPGGRVQIGRRCYIGASLLVCHTGIRIDDDVIISWGVTVVDHDSHSIDWQQRSADVRLWGQGRKSWNGVNIGPVHIEERAWIGFGASILKGVRIGRGSVIGAGSVVTRDVPPYVVVAGNPARIVRQLEH